MVEKKDAGAPSVTKPVLDGTAEGHRIPCSTRQRTWADEVSILDGYRWADTYIILDGNGWAHEASIGSVYEINVWAHLK